MDIDQEHLDLAPAQAHTLSENSTPMPAPSSDAVANAIERRLREQRKQPQQDKGKSYAAFDEDHEKRQEFRRMVDPGILRPNARPLALESLQTLLKLAENIIQNPNELKYQKFKTTNGNIKRLIIDPKGTLEYAREMGFDPQVEDYQPLYVFKPRRIGDLRIGAEILKEALDREMTKEERAERAKQQEKAVAAAQIANIKQQFLDDRKSQALRTRREEEQRQAQAAVAARQPPMSPTSPPGTMPSGDGRILSENVVSIQEDYDD
ncbi:uncharacterized protein PHACADRAFT_250072 [Phanerochaete carnosa HHB-10118-sp]|uniref:PUB domain-containing protein n=1 Tax=Phanerochaete carnosa (strain HHB-10118-sp) TaxID=650164 RepID=K5WJD4_PHACS|nr:uncharacterized protein PHACADRAFT_250072 [Phanerochaete carnosa HHB-10118-sp]EKM59515.1 hypothetical protein PHACADRAFT_250072 [Phanerochaete carnosa HHB-10118-sp]